jgi:TonB family protein
MQAVQAFDEHLRILRSASLASDGTDQMSLLIIAPGASAGDVFAQRQQTMQAVEERLSRTLADEMSRQTAAPGAPAAAPSGAISRIKVGGNVQALRIVTKVAPVYPQLAKSARVEGVVHLAAIIGQDGTMQELHSLGGPALLIQAAMDAVKQWVYAPTLLNGEPVAVETTIDVNFTLNQ